MAETLVENRRQYGKMKKDVNALVAG